MQKRGALLTTFLFFLLLSALLLFLFRQTFIPVSGALFERVTLPLQQSLYASFAGLFLRAGQSERVAEQNRELAKKIIDQSELQKEVKALRDQYDLNLVPAKQLLPAQVIGMKSFIPGVSLPEEVIINVGSSQGVKKGQTVVLTNNIVGNIARVSEKRSLVSLITNKTQSLTVKTVKTGAVGILKGKGNGMLVLENVVLSEKLEKGDIVATRGDVSLDGTGYPPDLVIGRIASIDKKASDLFQTAEVESLINFTSISTVFVIIE